MLIQKLQLKNFKRFTDLTIDLTGETATPKLVLLIGANGSGKSCIFDGFQRLKYITNNYEKSSTISEDRLMRDIAYFIKKDGSQKLIVNDKDHPYKDLNFYGVTAFRYIPTITKTQIGGQKSNDYKLFIEEEKDKFDQNIDILFSRLIASLSNKNDTFAQNFETKIKSGFKNVFGNNVNSLSFEGYKSPIIGQTPVKFLFSKGQTSGLDYSCLSAGEKMVFIILFDLYLNVLELENTIIYLDELDSHLNTSLQKNLLKEITQNWIPHSCQLWTASHSLGFIQYTQEYEKGVIIDLDNLNFDIPQVLEPISKNDPDKKYLDVALGETFLNTLMSELETKYENKVLVFSEGENLQYLERAKEIFAPNLSIRFLDGGGKSNLTSVYTAFSKSKTRHIIIFDCDAVSEKDRCKNPNNPTQIIFVNKLETNTNQPSGMENLFEPNLFNFTENYYKTKIDNGKSITELNKKQFCEFILGRNNPSDFANFKLIFDQIQDIIDGNFNN